MTGKGQLGWHENESPPSDCAFSLMITLTQIDDLMNQAISSAKLAAQDSNQAFPSQASAAQRSPPCIRLNLLYINAAAPAKSPICCCMRAQSDAAGMTEQVQTYRPMLFPVYGKCGGKKKEKKRKKWAQNKAGGFNWLWGCRTCWKQHPVYLDGTTEVGSWLLEVFSSQLAQSCSHTWTEGLMHKPKVCGQKRKKKKWY